MIDIDVEDGAWLSVLPGVEGVAREAAQVALGHGGATAGGSLLTILLADDAAVRELNQRFLGKDAATNVLSFPAAANPEGFLGDVALARETCAREALEQGKTLHAHLQHLVAHGVLHLLGYDHQDDAAAERMEDLERRILAALGVADPYTSGERGQ